MGGRYDDEFYDEIDGGSVRSAAVVVPWLHEALSPRSVLDVGCGRGSWLAAFRRCGVPDVLGLDGDHVDPATLHVEPSEFRAVDLVAPPDLDRRFDLVLSLEVAEHLPAAAAGGFVRFLTGAGPVVVFSAAIPGQGGVHHVNEQWPAYWAERFGAAGFRAIDAVRPRTWDDERVESYFAQNIVVYAHADVADHVEVALGGAWDVDGGPRALVHPRFFELVVSRRAAHRPAPPSLSHLLRQLPGATRRAVSARVGAARQR